LGEFDQNNSTTKEETRQKERKAGAVLDFFLSQKTCDLYALYSHIHIEQ